MSLEPIDQHRQCWEQLPWLLNGRLSAQSAAEVEEHVRSCEECRNELEAQRMLREHIRREEGLVLAPQASLQKLMMRIDSEEQAPTASSGSLNSREHRTRSRWLVLAVAVQGACIAVLLGLLWSSARGTLTAPRYTTLAQQPAAAAPLAVIRAVFASDIRVREMNELLRELQLGIVAGPSEAGVYTLQSAQPDLEHAEVLALAARLRADARVAFSEAAGMQP